MKDIGYRFRCFREAINKSKAELALEPNVNESIINDIEKGILLPHLDFLKILNKKYGLNINWLSENKGDMLSDSQLRVNKNLSGDITFKNGEVVQFSWICKGLKGYTIPYWTDLKKIPNYALLNLRLDAIQSIEFLDLNEQEIQFLKNRVSEKKILKANVLFQNSLRKNNIFLDYKNWRWKNANESGYIGKSIKNILIHTLYKKKCPNCSRQFKEKYVYCPFDAAILQKLVQNGDTFRFNL